MKKKIKPEDIIENRYASIERQIESKLSLLYTGHLLTRKLAFEEAQKVIDENNLTNENLKVNIKSIGGENGITVTIKNKEE